jgi:hypothetical protein
VTVLFTPYVQYGRRAGLMYIQGLYKRLFKFVTKRHISLLLFIYKLPCSRLNLHVRIQNKSFTFLLLSFQLYFYTTKNPFIFNIINIKKKKPTCSNKNLPFYISLKKFDLKKISTPTFWLFFSSIVKVKKF